MREFWIFAAATLTYRVIYADTDTDGVMYHARYLELFERGRNELFRLGGQSFRQLKEVGIILPVIECRVRYASPARFDEILTLETILARNHSRGLDFEYRLTGSDGAKASGETRHYYVDQAGRAIRAPVRINITPG